MSKIVVESSEDIKLLLDKSVVPIDKEMLIMNYIYDLESKYKETTERAKKYADDYYKDHNKLKLIKDKISLCQSECSKEVIKIIKG